MHRTTYVLAFALSAFAYACGKEPTTPPPPKVEPPKTTEVTPPAASAPSPSITFTPLPAESAPAAKAGAAPTVAVASVEIGNALGPDKRIQGVAGTLKPNDVVYVSVLTSGEGSATLKSRWTLHKDGKTTLVKEESQRVAPGNPPLYAFHAEKPGGWAKGDYEVELFVDGASAARRRFTIA